MSSIAYVYTVKLPASHPVSGFVPPVLKMNERAAPPAVYEPEEPKGLVIVSRLLDTEHEAEVLIGDVTEDREHVPDTRVMESGKRIVIIELL